jgi:hypothetical protein
MPETTTRPPLPAHFAASAALPAKLPLPDDHPVWRLLGAWVATRQRGEPALIAPHLASEAVLEDARAIIAAGGGPLRTGGELDVAATGRLHACGTRITDLDVRLSGKRIKEGGEERIVSHLTLTEVCQVADGTWKIARLLDDAGRALLSDPAFLRFLTTAPGSDGRAAGAGAGRPDGADGAGAARPDGA